MHEVLACEFRSGLNKAMLCYCSSVIVINASAVEIHAYDLR